MRPSLTGFPRESFSALLRQSLSAAELERMFEDDSTGSFEKLEQRLKTPKRPLAVARPPLLLESAGAGSTEDRLKVCSFEEVYGNMVGVAQKMFSSLLMLDNELVCPCLCLP